MYLEFKKKKKKGNQHISIWSPYNMVCIEEDGDRTWVGQLPTQFSFCIYHINYNLCISMLFLTAYVMDLNEIFRDNLREESNIAYKLCWCIAFILTNRFLKFPCLPFYQLIKLLFSFGFPFGVNRLKGTYVGENKYA